MQYPVLFKNPREQKLLQLIMELCQIPAPTGREQKRWEFCRGWLTDAGCTDVIVDSALNVIVPYNLQKKDIVVIAAHMDTVFPDMEPMVMKVENGRLYCPGAGDDTASLGIPSAAIGTYVGGGAHTGDEYLDIMSLPKGLKIADKLLDRYII